MSKRKAMQLAVDALEKSHAEYRGYGEYLSLIDVKSTAKAIAALKAELAKLEPDPVAWMMENADYPKIGRNLTFTPHDRWHASWTAIPLYRMEDL